MVRGRDEDTWAKFRALAEVTWAANLGGVELPPRVCNPYYVRPVAKRDEVTTPRNQKAMGRLLDSL